jgi:hypothetical protein
MREFSGKLSRDVHIVSRTGATASRITLERAARTLPDPFYLYLRFWLHHGFFPNLICPRTFNEKILAKLIFDRNPILTMIADKLEVRKYIADRVGVEYLPRILGSWGSADAIDIDTTWKRAVVKANHGSRWVFFIPDTRNFDLSALRKTCAQWLGVNFGDATSEWAYKAIRPRVFAEEWIGPSNVDDIVDYKIFCFDGEPKALKVLVGLGSGLRGTYYDFDFNNIGRNAGQDPAPEPVVKPPNFHQMLDLSRALSRGLDFVRVDMYNVDGRIYVGELTNYPLSGVVPFVPYSLDEQLGAYWKRSSMTYLPLRWLACRRRSEAEGYFGADGRRQRRGSRGGATGSVRGWS